jgi:hypothetical protein
MSVPSANAAMTNRYLSLPSSSGETAGGLLREPASCAWTCESTADAHACMQMVRSPTARTLGSSASHSREMPHERMKRAKDAAGLLPQTSICMRVHARSFGSNLQFTRQAPDYLTKTQWHAMSYLDPARLWLPQAQNTKKENRAPGERGSLEVKATVVNAAQGPDPQLPAQVTISKGRKQPASGEPTRARETLSLSCNPHSSDRSTPLLHPPPALFLHRSPLVRKGGGRGGTRVRHRGPRRVRWLLHGV